MLISVVIPTYRRPQLLIKCIEALQKQSFDTSSYEIVVVSDGPDQETEAALNGLVAVDGPALRYLPLAQKKGPAAARNYGWKNAIAPIIAFTDDDCLPDVNWLSEIWKNCQPDEPVAITGKVIVPIRKRPTDFELNTAGLQHADFITANCACTKKALELVDGFDEAFSMAWREDSDLEFKLIRNEIPIRKVKSAVVVHPVRASKWGVSIKEQKKTMFDALLYKKYPKLFRKRIQSSPPILYYAILIAFLVMIAGLLTHQTQLTTAGVVIWMTLTLYFTFMRLRKTKLSASHIAEMLYTSVLIPFISLYWHWYGAAKYKVLYI